MGEGHVFKGEARSLDVHSARTRGFSLMNSGKVSAFRSCTSEAEARAAAPMSPKAMFLKFRILVDDVKGRSYDYHSGRMRGPMK